MSVVAVLYNDDAHLLAGGSVQDRIASDAIVVQAGSIVMALRRRGHEAVAVASGSNVADLASRLFNLRPALVFNCCESFAGQSRLEPAVAGLLELIGFPFTGNPSTTLALAQDKAIAKQILAAHKVPVARGIVLRDATETLPAGLRPPLFVKTRFEDASHGISESSVCNSIADARDQAAKLIRDWNQDCLVEEFLPGREFNAGVLFAGELLPIAEVDYQLPDGLPRIVTYDAKWNANSEYDAGTPVRCPAENVDRDLASAIRHAALAAYHALGCRDYARVDIRLTATGEPLVLEVNPNPDLSPNAGLARAAAAAGIAYDELIDRLVAAALARA